MSLCRTIYIMSKIELIIKGIGLTAPLELVLASLQAEPMLILECSRCMKLTVALDVELPKIMRCTHCGRTFTINSNGQERCRKACRSDVSKELIGVIHRVD